MAASETGSRRRQLWRGPPILLGAVLVAVLTGRGALQDAVAPEPAAGTAGRAVAAGAPAPAPADAALRLQALLGQHSVLAADMMRGRLRGDPDLAQSADAALGKNTDAMGELVLALLGEQARRRFTEIWAEHVRAFFTYARAVADRDDALKQQAAAAADQHEGELAELLSAAAQGRLPTGTARSALGEHVDHLFDQADAFAAGNYQRADALYREGYRHAFGLGLAVATALLPPAQARQLATPSWRLRSELGRLLGEHVVLVVAAMRNGAVGAPNFATAAATADANTQELAAAVDTLFGAAAAGQFQSLWADHVDALISYSGGLAKDDRAQRAAAEQALARFEQRLAVFLDTATGDRLAASSLSRQLRGHDQMLLDESDAYAAKDYRTAHDLAYSAYQQMYDLAGALARAFSATVASRLPAGGVRTGDGSTAGTGGTAGTVGHRGHGG